MMHYCVGCFSLTLMLTANSVQTFILLHFENLLKYLTDVILILSQGDDDVVSTCNTDGFDPSGNESGD